MEINSDDSSVSENMSTSLINSVRAVGGGGGCYLRNPKYTNLCSKGISTRQETLTCSSLVYMLLDMCVHRNLTEKIKLLPRFYLERVLIETLTISSWIQSISGQLFNGLEVPFRSWFSLGR